MPPELQFLLFMVALAGLWIVLTRPARRQQRQVAEFQAAIEVGAEVMMTAGIFGTVRAVENDRVRLEIADGTVITVARQALVQRAPEQAAGPEPETTEE